jgi:hypothetical protein
LLGVLHRDRRHLKLGQVAFALGFLDRFLDELYEFVLDQ